MSCYFYSSKWLKFFFIAPPCKFSFWNDYCGYFFENMSLFLSVRPTGDLGDVCPPFESLSLICTELALLPIIPGDSPVYPDFRSPKSSEPFFDAISVFEKFGLNRSLYPPLERFSGCIKLLCRDGTLNYSSKLYDCFGLIVLPRPLYFSPLGDLGGVNPF